MKLLKNPKVAWLFTAVAIVVSLLFGMLTADADVLRVEAGNMVCDDAEVLSEETEQAVLNYNKKFDEEFYSFVAVATVDNMKGWEPDEYASELFNRWSLRENDFLLLLDIGGKETYLYHGGSYHDFDYVAYLNSFVNPSFDAGNYDQAVLELMPGMVSYFESGAGMDTELPEPETSAPENESAEAAGSAVPETETEPETEVQTEAETGAQSENASEKKGGHALRNVVLILVLLAAICYGALELLDHSRFNSWYDRYGQAEEDAVEFTPLLPWHRAGSKWFEKQMNLDPAEDEDDE